MITSYTFHYVSQIFRKSAIVNPYTHNMNYKRLNIVNDKIFNINNIAIFGGCL